MVQYYTMNISTVNDIELTTKWYNELKEEEGEEFVKIREFIDNQTNCGEKLVSTYITGTPPFPPEKRSDQIFLSNAIMQIIYFTFHMMLTKELFASWDSDELIERNKQLSDELYRRHAESAKFYHDLENSGAIEDLIMIILHLKLGDKYTFENGEKLLKICRRQVGEKLLKGKFLKSLKSFE